MNDEVLEHKNEGIFLVESTPEEYNSLTSEQYKQQSKFLYSTWNVHKRQKGGQNYFKLFVPGNPITFQDNVSWHNLQLYSGEQERIPALVIDIVPAVLISNDLGYIYYFKMKVLTGERLRVLDSYFDHKVELLTEESIALAGAKS